MNIIFFLLATTLYSLMEIEIEGKYGWMVKCPTPTVFKMGGKNFTLYHIYMTGFIIMISLITSQITFSSINSIFQGIFLTSYYTTLFLIVEDILWFILNPYFTLSKYSQKNIPWHANQPWILNSPLHNYIGVGYLLFVSWLLHEVYLFNYLVLSGAFVYGCYNFSNVYHKFYIQTHQKDIKDATRESLEKTDESLKESEDDMKKVEDNTERFMKNIEKVEYDEQTKLAEELIPIIQTEEEKAELRQRVLSEALNDEVNVF